MVVGGVLVVWEIVMVDKKPVVEAGLLVVVEEIDCGGGTTDYQWQEKWFLVEGEKMAEMAGNIEDNGRGESGSRWGEGS